MQQLSVQEQEVERHKKMELLVGEQAGSTSHHGQDQRIWLLNRVDSQFDADSDTKKPKDNCLKCRLLSASSGRLLKDDISVSDTSIESTKSHAYLSHPTVGFYLPRTY